MKKISLLATGNELVEGDMQDSNGHYFARSLFDAGATLFQHLQCSDQKEDIECALKYLLQHSDALIITGGLGPTSDDNTRFALSDVIEQPLVFNEEAWEAIRVRFERYQFPLIESNRQQALFPEGAQRYENPNGTAQGCHVNYLGKHLFLLPGPPRECLPIFEQHVKPTLETLGFFHKKQRYRWLTMGLSESHIAEKVDALVRSRGYETGYRWSYPYLEIKLSPAHEDADQSALVDVKQLLDPNIVSTDQKNAIELLELMLNNFAENIAILDETTEGVNPHRLVHSKLHYDAHVDETRSRRFCVYAEPRIDLSNTQQGLVTLSCKAYEHGQLCYEHAMTVPNRGSEIGRYTKHYLAWQLRKWLAQD